GAALTSLGTMHSSREASATFIASAAARPETGAEWMGLLAAMGKLWQAGVTPDWNAFHAGAKRNRLALPTYPFERRRYFIEPGTIHVDAATTTAHSVDEAASSREAVSDMPAPDSVVP